MRFHTFLLKYGEIGIKGKNRHLFEDALVRQVRYALKDVDGQFDVHKSQARIYVDCEGDYDYDETVEHLKKVFGLVGICPVVRMEDKGFEELKKDVVAYMDEMYPDKNFTFKVESRRAKKSYPLNSMEISRDLGEAILYAFPESGIKVDVHHPDVMVNVEVRNEIYIYSQIIPGAGGMPVGTNGSAMLLLSGGIDSPVAGYMVSKRGVSLEATYFHAPPYTSERAKQKVVDLAKKVAKYSGPIKLHVVNFTDIQLYIYDQCPHDELTIIMRRYMMRIAEHFAKEDGCLGMITGESIGQVASQTMQSLAAAGASVTHVDASKGMVAWAKENAASSGLSDRPIRWLVDDCVKFVEREIRRGNHYDAIIMDPPSYGRGPKGEIWKIEDAIHPLIKLCTQILSDDPLFFLVNSYTTGLAPAVLTYMLGTELKKWNGHVDSQEIGLPVTHSGLVLPCGASGRWEAV